MKQLHMILQGKGGVGKSYVASLLAQHYMARSITPICIDTDPVNATFAGYKSLPVNRLELMVGDDLDPRAFDQLVEQVMGADDNSIIIVDNGAATFVPLCAWMLENGAVSFFKDAGVELILHSVLTGGQAMGDTLVGLNNLLKNFPNTPSVIWLNEYFGKPERNGKGFETSDLFKKHAERIHALIRITSRRKETFGTDLDIILSGKKLFAEAAQDESLSIMGRQRLAIIWREINDQITAANL
jgi:hypothetical protein